ncbi:MAG: BsaA family SipW-dependent biofilm matrix protein [Oscillospiraceae bacterium]
MKKINKKAPLIALASLTAVGIIGSTMAYYYNSSQFTNNFQTSGYSTTDKEIFNPNDGDDLNPGAKVNKDVIIENTGKSNILVRVKYEEKIGDGQYTVSDLTSEPTLQNPWIADFVNSDSFTYQDGYYYYMDFLKPNEKVQHLDSVTLWKGYNPSQVGKVQYFGYKIDPSSDDTSDNNIRWLTSGIQSDGSLVTVDDKTITISNPNSDEVEEYNLAGIKYETQYNGVKYSLKVTIETAQATDSNGKELPNTTFNNITSVVNAWNNVQNLSE